MTDSKGCSVTEAFGITEPSELEASISGQTNVLCNGASTGAALGVVIGRDAGLFLRLDRRPAGDGTASALTGLGRARTP
ncbi:MAG: hypothetical protein IPM81_20410 [Saprospirales bacterium]|nr:hypothetical protein [Saprospirales bacterium]